VSDRSLTCWTPNPPARRTAVGLQRRDGKEGRRDSSDEPGADGRRREHRDLREQQALPLRLVAARYPRWVSALFTMPFVVNPLVPVEGPTAQAGVASALPLMLLLAAQVLGDAQRRRGVVVVERDTTRAEYAANLRERAAMEERARIARELHDVVAHHLSMISVQAETVPRRGRYRA
jgi:signal transduction histidine kinase